MEAAIGMGIREHKSSFAVYVVLRVLVIAVAVLEFFNGDYEAVFLCILTLLLLLAPAFVQVRFRIELPSALEVIVLVFVFAAEILGEISSFYEIFPFWDTVLHTMNGFLAAAIGFSLVDLLNRSDRVKFELSPLYLAIVSFCFSMTTGVVWEFFEFSMDMNRIFAPVTMQSLSRLLDERESQRLRREAEKRAKEGPKRDQDRNRQQNDNNSNFNAAGGMFNNFR